MLITKIIDSLNIVDKKRLHEALQQIFPAPDTKIDLRAGWECNANKHGMYLEMNILVIETVKTENSTTSEQIFNQLISQSKPEQAENLQKGITVFLENAILPYTLLDCSCKNIPDLGTVFHCSFIAKVNDNN